MHCKHDPLHSHGACTSAYGRLHKLSTMDTRMQKCVRRTNPPRHAARKCCPCRPEPRVAPHSYNDRSCCPRCAQDCPPMQVSGWATVGGSQATWSAERRLQRGARRCGLRRARRQPGRIVARATPLLRRYCSQSQMRSSRCRHAAAHRRSDGGRGGCCGDGGGLARRAGQAGGGGGAAEWRCGADSSGGDAGCRGRGVTIHGGTCGSGPRGGSGGGWDGWDGWAVAGCACVRTGSRCTIACAAITALTAALKCTCARRCACGASVDAR